MGWKRREQIIASRMEVAAVAWTQKEEAKEALDQALAAGDDLAAIKAQKALKAAIEAYKTPGPYGAYHGAAWSALLAIAWYADECQVDGTPENPLGNGEWFASLETIAVRAGISRSGVVKATERFQADGLLTTRRPRKSDKRKTNTWTLHNWVTPNSDRPGKRLNDQGGRKPRSTPRAAPAPVVEDDVIEAELVAEDAPAPVEPLHGGRRSRADEELAEMFGDNADAVAEGAVL